MEPIKGKTLIISTDGNIENTVVSVDGVDVGNVSSVHIDVGIEECSAWVCYTNPSSGDVSVQGIVL